MFGLGLEGKPLLEEQWQGTLSDYVTAIAWSPTADILAASSAAGEVNLWTPDAFIALTPSTGASINSIGFSPDGQYLAAGGQDGQVRIWQMASQAMSTESALLSTASNAWVEHLAWSPVSNQLAMSIGRCVQIWDAQTDAVVTTLSFAASSVLGVAWHPQGHYLAVCGHRGVKVWNAQNWQDEPYTFNIRAASIAIAWSPDGRYLASGNMDCTLMVLEWNNPDPWIMQGFSGKIRSVNWSSCLTATGAPLLAASCADTISVWQQGDKGSGWDARVLDLHEGTVQALAFRPDTFLLTSAANDGYVCLWDQAEQVAQILAGATAGFSCLAWHPQGQQLAAGSQNGELLIWSTPTPNGNG